MLLIPPGISGFQYSERRPCAYLPGQSERLLFTWASRENGRELYDGLSNIGFRRSRTLLYRPACPHCSACLSARIRVDEFAPSKSQKKNLRRNAGLMRSISLPKLDKETYRLFKRYVSARHGDGGMDCMDAEEFNQMADDSPTRTRVIRYFEPSEEDSDGVLVAAAITDTLKDGLSMVYSFYDPDRRKDSLGTYMILDHIDIARTSGLSHLHLGYWVSGSPKMDYKRKFGSLEVYADNAWRNLDEVKDGAPAAEH